MKKKPPQKSEPTPEYDPQREQNVLLERIEKKVDAIGEGHSGLVQNINDIKATLDEHGIRFERIEAKLGEHNKRFDRIEFAITENSKDIQLLKATTKRIEEKLDTVTIDHEQRIQKLETVH